MPVRNRPPLADRRRTGDNDMNRWAITLLVGLVSLAAASTRGETLRLKLRHQAAATDRPGEFDVRLRAVEWDAARTAVIVCDVWDRHHSINAVRRLEQFAPRLNEFVREARRRGATIIHAPSDCMAAYADHPARARAVAAPRSANLPPEINEWCSIVPRERRATYPIDQSDGGSDDDPQEHAAWAAQLVAEGRTPGTPWLRQSDVIEIDAERDFISDRGDEVWNALEARGIRRVILSGVHVNMCVPGRPFGLRRLVLGGKQVVLLADLTDSMYNPAMWPYVDHHTGTARIVEHIERYVCPTITSDQLLGGEPFRFDAATNVQPAAPPPSLTPREELERRWTDCKIPGTLDPKQFPGLEGYDGPIWYRCVIRVPAAWRDSYLLVDFHEPRHDDSVWFNGSSLNPKKLDADGIRHRLWKVSGHDVAPGDANLLVVRSSTSNARQWRTAPELRGHKGQLLSLAGRWQFRLGDDPAWSNMPLPPKFGTSTDIVIEAPR
jgi:nicotinamidase-related amidase